MHPPWDNLSQFLTSVSLSELVNIQKARESEIANMLTMGCRTPGAGFTPSLKWRKR